MVRETTPGTCSGVMVGRKNSLLIGRDLYENQAPGGAAVSCSTSERGKTPGRQLSFSLPLQACSMRATLHVLLLVRG